MWPSVNFLSNLERQIRFPGSSKTYWVDWQALIYPEEKSQGPTLSGVAEQTIKYITSIPESLPNVTLPLRFAYETTGVETFFGDLKDPDPRSRRIFAFHQPKTLNHWHTEEDTLRDRPKTL